MNRMLATCIATATTLVLSVPASAQEVSGVVKSYDSGARTIVLDDGRNYILDKSVSDQLLKEGSKVRIVFEKRQGKKVITRVVAE